MAALSLFSLFLHIIHASALTPDGEVLLELKSAFADSKNMLRSWRSQDPHPCAWAGVACNLSDLRVRSINLPYSGLGGLISPSIGKLQRLQRLALHENTLHGPIPVEIKHCLDLRALYLRGNYLDGSIPPEIGALTHLTILDLSNNLLRGTIPPSIGSLARLRYLNLSTNFFSGEIPNVGILGSFRNTSFVGNLELCGLPMQKLCRGSLGFPAVLPHSGALASPDFSDDTPPPRTTHFLNGVLIGVMSTIGLALLLIFGFLWVCLLSRKGHPNQNYIKVDKQLVQDTGPKLITFHGNLPNSSSEIIKKLELLDEEDIVGSGGFGTVYKMSTDDGNTFAVKRIERNHDGFDPVFEREVAILGCVKHNNLVNLRGYCRFSSSKLLIYDYLVLGGLDCFLHDHGQDDQWLNWNARMKIALGSARGLAYLHHDCSPAIVHRDIKSSNILLDRSLEPHVSDSGLAKLLVDDHTHVTTVVAGTFGYLAPEYLHSGRATEKSDVYSFGVLLFELITGKRPTDPSFLKKGLNIVGWMNTLAGNTPLEDIIDERCGPVEVEAVEAILDIAMMCTDANPDERPSMNRVLQMLEEEVLPPCPRGFYDSQLDI